MIEILDILEKEVKEFVRTGHHTNFYRAQGVLEAIEVLSPDLCKQAREIISDYFEKMSLHCQ